MVAEGLYSTSNYRIIKLACKGERVEVDWDGTFSDLTRLFTEGTWCIPQVGSSARRSCGLDGGRGDKK